MASSEDQLQNLREVLLQMFPEGGEDAPGPRDRLESYTLTDIVKVLFEIKTRREFQSAIENGERARECAAFLYDKCRVKNKDLAKANRTLNHESNFSEWRRSQKPGKNIGNEFMEFLNGCRGFIDPCPAYSPKIDQKARKLEPNKWEVTDGEGQIVGDPPEPEWQRGELAEWFKDIIRDRYDYDSEGEADGEEVREDEAGREEERGGSVKNVKKRDTNGLGYLYVFTDQIGQENPRYKIGSSYDPHKRLRQLRTGNIDLKFVYMHPAPSITGPTKYRLLREFIVHDRLKKYRIETEEGGPREWYRGCNINQIMDEFCYVCELKVKPKNEE